MNLSATKLDYFDDMQRVQSKSTLLSYLKCDDGRDALILDSTIFHPQGGGQPADTGFIDIVDSDFRFTVQDVRLKDGIVFHYGCFKSSNGQAFDLQPECTKQVILSIDKPRRELNSRLHTAGHLLDVCMQNVGLGHCEPGKAYHFPDGPFVEYRGQVLQNELQSKQRDLELSANTLISIGAKVSTAVLSYTQAAEQCGGCLPDYISKSSTPRIIWIGDNPGCPCGGTHVSDISEIGSIKVSQMRAKKGLIKVSYNVGL